MVSGIVNYLDRGTLAVASSAIRADLGLSLAQMGLLLSAFSWSYALCQFPVGGLVDRIGPRRLLGIGLIVWSIAQAAGGIVSTFGWFIVARIVLGIGEAPQFPSAARVVSNWFPLRARGTPTGIFNAASPLGTALAPLLLSILVASLDWRWAFIATGAAGLVVAVVWFALYRDPVRAQLTVTERNYLDADAQSTVAAPKRRSPNGAACSRTARPGDADRLFRFRVPELGVPHLAAGLPDDGAAHEPDPHRLCRVGAVPVRIRRLAAGRLAVGLVTRRSRSPVVSRRNAVVVAMLGMVAFTIPAALAQSNTVALACISVVIFLANAASACSWALATAAAPPSRIASLGAIQNFGGFIGGALAPILTGIIAQKWSFVPALLTAAAIAFAGAMAYLLLVRKPIPEQAANAAPGPLPA